VPHYDPAIIVAIYDAVTAAGERAVLDIDVFCPVGVVHPDAVRSGPGGSVESIFY